VIYGIGFCAGAIGGSGQGCWIGVSPDQAIVAGGEIGIDIDGSGGGQVFEIWGASMNMTIMGNYIGVGIDGATPLANKRFLRAASGTTVQIGSNGDGNNDAIEANIIANHFAYLFRFGGPLAAITFRANSFLGNTGEFFNDPANSFNGVVLGTGDAAAITPTVSASSSRAELAGWVPVSGDIHASNRRNAEIHIYEADPATSSTAPQGSKWLATFVDNGPSDLDPATNTFRFNICSLPIASTGAQLVVHETVSDDVSAGSSLFSAAFPLPDVSTLLSISQTAPGSVSLSWQMNGVLQTTPDLSPPTWTDLPGCSPVTLPAGPGSAFFRVAQQMPE